MSHPSSRLAITGLACRYPGLDDAAALAQCLATGPFQAGPQLPPTAARYADFGIPPIYRQSINRVQLDVLDLAQAALAQAGWSDGAFDAERTDVLFCTALAMNRCIENHARVLGVELAAAYGDVLPLDQRGAFFDGAKRQLDSAFAATSHDKVGEMASTVAARVAACFKLRGRALALEAGDLGGVEALLSARDALTLGLADAVLVVGAQRIESPASTALVAALAGDAAAAAWREGACALVLQRPPSDPRRVLAWLDGIHLAPAPPSTQDNDGLRPPASVAPRLWVLGGQRQQAPTEWQAGHDTIVQGRDACGYGHAVDALSTLAQAVLGCHAPQHGFAAAVALGQGIEGDAYALHVSASHTMAEQAVDVDAAPASAVGVLAYGARFGAAPGSEAYWQTLRSGHTGFRPLQGPRFQPGLYRTPADNPTLGYYIEHASFADTSGPDATATLALAAAQEALQALAAQTVPWDALADQTLVVTATNLTSGDERRWSAQALLPRIEQAIDAAAQRLALAAQDRARGLVALRQAAALPVEIDGTHPTLARRLSASHIGRRVAAQLGIVGARSVALESACAGSLAAIELAVNALRSGRCSLALVVGVELPVNVHDLSLCSAQRMLAPGLIATFTEQAQGFTPGDGAGVLVLARADEAKRLGLRVQALLRAVGSSTESKSVIAPNEAGQLRSMQRAFAQVDFGPDDVDFVEAHGTGTLIGDEVEVNSLAMAYRNGHAPRHTPLPLGVLKAQFGHCFAAAGMASVVKTLLALHHHELPRNHYAHPLKPALGLAERGFDPLQQSHPWPRRHGRPRRAAINAFGTGGINVHLLLEESEAG